MASDTVASNGSRVSHNQMNRATSIGTLGIDAKEYVRMVPLERNRTNTKEFERSIRWVHFPSAKEQSCKV